MSPSSWTRKMIDFLDIFRIVSDDSVLAGNRRHGGVLGIVCATIVAVLILSECITFFTPGDFKSTMNVNRREMGKKERVNFNISFTQFPCGCMIFESFQANAGLKLTKQEDTLVWTRTRLLQGDPSLPLGEYTQNMGLERTLNEGCRVQGAFYIDKVPSNFVLSCRAFSGPQSVPPTTDVVFHDLWFGEKRLPLSEIAEGNANPLAGVKRDGDPPRTVYQYFLSIVPTVVHDPYKRGDDARHVGFQYTAISSTVQAYVPPGLYFAHHHSPIAVEMTRRGDTWSHFLVNIAAVSGGVYVCTELLVNVINMLHERNLLPPAIDELVTGGNRGL